MATKVPVLLSGLDKLVKTLLLVTRSAQRLMLEQKYLDSIFYIFPFSGTFRWDDAKDKILLREVCVVELYKWNIGSNRLGKDGLRLQNWSIHMRVSRRCQEINELCVKDSIN